VWKAITEPASEPKPKKKEKQDGRGAFIAARSIIKRIARKAAQLSSDAFANAAKTMTAPECPGWLREFFEAEPVGTANLLDPSNPDRDLILGASDGAIFEAGYDISGPSLDLG
jgi:hypothetical protein